MSEQTQTETVESSTTTQPIVNETASSAEEQVITTPEVPEAPENDGLILKRKTAERFESLDGIIKSQQATIDQLQKTSQGAPLQHQEGEPKEEEFDNPDDYLIAKGAFQGMNQVIGIINQNQVTREADQRNFTINQQVQAHTGRVQAFQAEHTDFQQVIGGSMLNVSDATGNLTMAAQVILEQVNSPAIEYHLASNPELAMALNQATPAQAGAIVARLSDQLTASPVTNNSPPPPIGSEGTGTGVGEQPDDFNRKYPNAEFI